MLTKTELKNLLDKYGLKPNKLLGQNFLIDQNILKKIIVSAGLSKNDTVLEAGPGLGVLTEALASVAGQVIAVEKDERMAKILQNILAEKKIGNIEIIKDDILNIPNSVFQVPYYKVVANIPYYLTAHLIRQFLESKNPPSNMILMLQKEVAERICAKPPKMSLLAVSVQFYGEPKIISIVSKNSFWPKPKVDSAILEISGIERNGKQTPRVSSERFFNVVRAGFSHPRKQLVNNLGAELNIGREEIIDALKKIGIEPKQRAETLSLNDWKKLTEILKPET